VDSTSSRPPSDARDTPLVAVLLCTYQGASFLAQQLDSIEGQTHTAWRVWASDDGSTDGTLTVLDKYRARWGADRLTIVHGPRSGSAANFLSLTCRPDIEAEMFAWADQDDVWLPDKLARAVAALSQADPTAPLLYGTRTILTDVQDRAIGLSTRFERPPCFANALVQNVAGGNTMVFNRAARDLIARAGPQVSIVAHDWWAYQLISGAGGTVLYDAEPSVRYRQHANNQIGTNLDLLARVLRLRLLMGGEFRQWLDKNLAALDAARHLLTPSHRQTLDDFTRWRRAPLRERLAGLRHSPVHRQTRSGHLALCIAGVLKRL